MTANPEPILQPISKEVVLIFNSYYLRSIFDKALAATDINSIDGSRQSIFKTFWKGFTILNVIENIHH